MSIHLVSGRRALPLVTAMLLLSLGTAPSAWALTFVRIGEGTLQNLNTYAASGTFCQFTNSTTTWATNGQFSAPMGTLGWTGQDKLEVVARIVQASSQGVPAPCWDSWRALNAEDFPLVFTILDGDPAAFLRITPRLVGSVSHLTGTGGHPSTSTLTIDMRMTVLVNGQAVSQDRMYLVNDQTTGQSATFPMAFPKGNLNTVVIPGAAASGTEVSVSLFAFARVTASGTFSSFGSSPYGNDLPILVTVEAVGPVGVGESASAPLSLGVRPNPSAGEPRVSYTLPRAAKVELDVYDIRGALIARLVDRVEDAGRHEMTLARSIGDRGRLRPGIYLMQLQAGDEHQTAKLVLTE